MTAYEIMRDWASALSSDEALSEWISKTFGAPLTVRIGYDAVTSFGPGEAPYIVFSPAGEETGPERDEVTFDIAMFLGLVKREEKGEPSAAKIDVNDAMELKETAFSPLALEAIAAHCNPDLAPGMAEGQTFPPRDGYCERQIILTVTLPNTFNLRQTPWR